MPAKAGTQIAKVGAWNLGPSIRWDDGVSRALIIYPFALRASQPNAQLSRLIRRTRMPNTVASALRDATNPDIAMFALTPNGRTGPMKPRRRRVAWEPPGDLLFRFCLYTVIVSMFVIPALWNFLLGPEYYKIAVYLSISPLAFYAYSATCWNIRRLHDLNQSAVRLLSPALIHPGRILTPIAVLLVTIRIPGLIPATMRNTAIDVGLIIAALVIALISAAIYQTRVFEPHQKRWKRDVTDALGDDLPNAHGLPPKRTSRALMDGI